MRSESLYRKPKTEVAATSTEEPKAQASSEGKNNSQNMRKQNQANDGQKKNKKEVECFSCGKKGHYAKECQAKPADRKRFNYSKVRHHKDKCPQPPKEKQIVKAYVINVVPSSSNAPNCGEEGKGRHYSRYAFYL